MERGGRTFGARALSLAALALLALPTAGADVGRAPVQAGAEAQYQADVGAILAQLRAHDPQMVLDFTFARATVYELALPAHGGAATRGVTAPQVPTVLWVQHLQAGRISVDPTRGANLLLANDPRGFGVDQLPAEAPRDPARFAVDSAAALAPSFDQDRLRIDPRDLHIEGGLHYAAEGLQIEKPLRAHAEGGLLALLTRGPIALRDERIQTVRELADGATGERVLLVQAEGARVDLAAAGMTAVLRVPEGSLAAGAEALADIAGKRVGASPGARVASGADGLAFGTGAGLLGLGEGDSGRSGRAGLGDEGASYVPLDARLAAEGALLGSALALAAAALAGAWGAGKYGLFALLGPLYARLQNDEILTNHTREAIYRYVTEHPGVNVSEVVKQFGLGWGATVYHLRVLERNHLLVGSRQGRQVCYFQNGGRYHGQMAGISVLRNANAAQVARVVIEHAGIQQREVCKVTGLAQPTVSWHLQRLEEAHLVSAEGAPRKRYTALPALQGLAERGFLAQPAQAAEPAPTASVATAA